MSLLLITATATITITTAVCAATSTAGATVRTVDGIITAVATARQIESGDLPVSGYQGPQSRAYGPMQSRIRAFLLEHQLLSSILFL